MRDMDQQETMPDAEQDRVPPCECDEELHHALEEAEEGRRLLDALMEYLPMGITIADAPEVRIKAVSRYGRELTQRPPEQIEGIPVEEHVERWDIYRADGVTRATNEELPLTRAVQKGEIVSGEEWTLVRADGKKIAILTTAAPVRDAQGNITGGVIGWQDITERKRVEEDLRESERRFRIVADFTYDWEYWLSESGEFIYSSPSCERVTGYSPEEFAHDPSLLATIVHPDDQERVIDHLKACVPPHMTAPLDFRIVRRDGEVRWISHVCLPVCDEQGRCTGTRATNRDITDRMRAVEALEAERARLQAVLDSLPVAVWIADQKSTVIQTNKAVERIWGAASVPYGIEEYREYKGWWADTGEPLAAEDWALARAALKGEVSTGEVIDIERFDGTRGTILNNASPVRDSEGHIIGAVAVAQDITDIRIAEEQLRERAEELETVMEVAPVAIWIGHDPETRSITGNRMANEFYEAEPGENVSATVVPVRRFFQKGRELAPEQLPMQESAATNADVHDEELDVLLPSGKWRFMLGSASPLRDAEGRVRGSVGAFVDITERKQAEEALARTLEETQRDRHFIAAIEGISEAALMVGSLQEILQAITVKIREGMETHSCTLFLLDQERQELEAVAACNIPEQVGFRIPAGEGFVGKVLRERRTLYVRDAEHDPLVTNPHVKRAGLRSILGTTLIGRRGPVGVVYVDEITEREFTPEERRLLETLAARTALVIENAQLLEQLERNFLLLQRALIPPAPKAIPGYRLASVYRPGVRGMEVGGDFYDLSSTEAGCVGIMIGDVVAKGIPSASLAAATRSTVRAFMYESSSPSEALTHTNAVINQEKSDPTLFVTVLAAVLDPATGCICYSSAGHPPPAIYRADTGEVEFLENGNPPVGVLDIYEFREAKTHLAKGDKIVFYTDGLDEARHDSVLFGPEGIERVLREVGGRSPDDIIAALLGAALDWAHGVIHDDTAIIVIERTGE